MSGVLTRRALNRTFLHRQHLDARTTAPVETVVARLVGVQAQEPNWAHVGLASRIEGYAPADGARLVEERVLVRSPLLRGTQHLTTGDDYRWLRPTVAPLLERMARAPYYARETSGIPAEELATAAREVLAGRTLRRSELSAALVARYPGRRGAVLAAAVESLLPVVHDPATSAWGSWWSRRNIAVTEATAWLGAALLEPDPRRLVRRYLAAYGPADVMDVQVWSGLTRLRPLVDDMRDELRVLQGPDGRELLDVPDGVLVDEDAPAPVRLLAAFDDAVLGHRDRTRILPEEIRREVMPGYSMVHATVLVDGFVAGRWEVADGGLALHALRPWSPRERDDVVAEAERVRRSLGLEGAVTLA